MMMMMDVPLFMLFVFICIQTSKLNFQSKGSSPVKWL